MLAPETVRDDAIKELPIFRSLSAAKRNHLLRSATQHTLESRGLSIAILHRNGPYLMVSVRLPDQRVRTIDPKETVRLYPKNACSSANSDAGPKITHDCCAANLGH